MLDNGVSKGGPPAVKDLERETDPVPLTILDHSIPVSGPLWLLSPPPTKT